MATQYSVGQSIQGRYMLREEVGHGGMAVVWRATDLQQEEKTVAIKFLNISDDSRRTPGEVDRLKRRFEEEYAKHVALKHPNIVQLVESGMDASGVPFIVMEFLDGKTLDQELAAYRTTVRKGAYPYHPQLYLIMRQLLDAVGYLHQQGIIHRDLKPQNIFIVPKGAEGLAVYLLDFGIALSLRSDQTRLTQTGMLVGTPLYMAPEQIASYKDRSEKQWGTGPQSDIFSLATILYEAVTGKASVIFNTQTPNVEQIVLIDHLSLDVPSPDPGKLVPGINPVLRELIMSGMAKRPDARIQTVEAFRELLEQAEQIDIRRKATSVPPPVSSRPPPPSERKMFDVGAPTQLQEPMPMQLKPREPPPPPRRALSPPASSEAPKVDPMPPPSRLPDTIPKKSLAPIVVMAGALFLGICLAIVGTKWKQRTPSVTSPVTDAMPSVVTLSAPHVPRPSVTVPVAAMVKPHAVVSSDELADQWLSKGIALRNAGNCQEALECFIKAESNRPDDPTILREELSCEKRPKARQTLEKQLKKIALRK